MVQTRFRTIRSRTLIVGQLDRDHKRRAFMLTGALGSILLGLPYLLGAFGPTEAEVAMWGLVSLCLGAVLVLLSVGIGGSDIRMARTILALGYVVLALLQVLPTLLWFLFHGSGISDGTPPSAFVAHWAYSMPHFALFAVSIIVLYHLFRVERPRAN